MKLKFLNDVKVDGVIKYKKGDIVDIPEDKNSHLHFLKRGAVEYKEEIVEKKTPVIDEVKEVLDNAEKEILGEEVVEEKPKKKTKAKAKK